jgi:hypothetical protein
MTVLFFKGFATQIYSIKKEEKQRKLNNGKKKWKFTLKAKRREAGAFLLIPILLTFLTFYFCLKE